MSEDTVGVLPRSAAAMAGVMAAVAFAVGLTTGLFVGSLPTGADGGTHTRGAHLPLTLLAQVYENKPGEGGSPWVLGRSDPTRLVIGSIGVDTELMQLGLTAQGTVEVPPTGFPAGWYEPSPTPGEAGTAVMLGHVDWAGPGVFHDLAAVALGDEIAVTRADGSTATFEVIGVESWPKELFPMATVFGGGSIPMLALITCGGVFDATTGHYVDNTLVWAELVSSTSAPATG